MRTLRIEVVSALPVVADLIQRMWQMLGCSPNFLMVMTLNQGMKECMAPHLKQRLKVLVQVLFFNHFFSILGRRITKVANDYTLMQQKNWDQRFS